MALICNPNLWGYSREILSSRHPPLHSEFEAGLVYLRPDLNSNPTPTPPATLTPSPASNKKTTEEKLKAKYENNFYKALQEFITVITPPPKKSNPQKGETQEKTTQSAANSW